MRDFSSNTVRLEAVTQTYMLLKALGRESGRPDVVMMIALAYAAEQAQKGSAQFAKKGSRIATLFHPHDVEAMLRDLDIIRDALK